MYGRVRVAGADPSGKTQHSSGTVVAAWPDRLRILLLPDQASTFPLRLEDGAFTWELRGGLLRLTQTDSTRWLFPSGRLREARDVIELVR